MSEQRVSASPIEGPASERAAAAAELRQVERDRNACLVRWSELRSQLQAQKNGQGVALAHAFEREVVLLHELDARLEECKRRVREADVKVRRAMLRWTLESSMEASRARSQVHP
jgi:hypothetical protein